MAAWSLGDAHWSQRNGGHHLPAWGVAVVFAALVLAGCGGGTTITAKAARTNTTTEPLALAAQTWPSEWCQASVGITKDQLYRIMGPPTSASATAATWTTLNYQFSALFNPDRSVRELDIISGSADCATSRT